MPIRSMLTGLAALMLFACSSPDEMADTLGGTAAARAETAGATAFASAQAQSSGGPAQPVTFADSQTKGEAARDFSYAWPAEVSSIPVLAERFKAERDQLLAEQKKEWAEALAEFGDNCVSCVNRSYEHSWDVVADLPRFLSLSAFTGGYSGGAHGYSNFGALIWDRETGAGFDPKALFRSPAALQDALGAPWCKALKAERMKRMEGYYTEDSVFPCPDIAELVVIVGSSNRKAFDRIGLLAAPYVAGSYAEGPYEVTLPVTPKVLAAVKPGYRTAFALGK